MTDDRQRTQPSQDALTEPIEGHVDVDSATDAHRSGPSETLAATGGAAAQKPVGFLAGAGLTDHDQPVEGGREEAEDGSAMDEPGIWRRHEEERAP